MRELRVKVNGIEMQCREQGGGGEAVVLLHFSGANLVMWQRVVPSFAERYRVILVDLRGHGRTDQPEGGYHMDVMARDVVGVLRQLGVEQGAHVVGSSLGAEVGLAMAANDPHAVISLACDGALTSECGPYGVWDGPEAAYEDHVARQLERMRSAPQKLFPAVDALVDDGRASLSEIGWWNEHVEAMERYGAHRTEDGRYRRSFGKAARLCYMKNYYRYRLEEYYRRVTCPLLMLPDPDDARNPRSRKAMEGLRDLAGHAQIVEVDGWVHPYGWMLDPQRMVGAVLEFMGEAGR